MITIITGLCAVIISLLILVVDFALATGLVYLICWCLGLVFSFKLALGVWLILKFIKLFMNGFNN